MIETTIRPILSGHKALVVGIANDMSIAYGCAKAFRMAGADLAVTWLNEKARPYVEPLADELQASVAMPLDVEIQGQMEAVFDAIHTQWGRLDILVHSIAFAPKEDLQGGLLDCSAEGFAKAMDISCHSFIRMAKLAAPLMTEGGAMFAMSYYGANRVVPNYNVMGPVKAALEAACRYLAYELRPQAIRVHAISPGPLKTRAASGLKDFGSCSTRRNRRHPSANLSISWMSVSPVPIWPRPSPGASPAAPSMSMVGQTSSPDRGNQNDAGMYRRPECRLVQHQVRPVRNRAHRSCPVPRPGGGIGQRAEASGHHVRWNRGSGADMGKADRSCGGHARDRQNHTRVAEW